MGAQAIRKQVVWLDIPCIDLDRATRFDSAVLGCEVRKRAPGAGFDREGRATC